MKDWVKIMWMQKYFIKSFAAISIVSYSCGSAMPEKEPEENIRLPVDSTSSTPVNVIISESRMFEYLIRSVGKIIAAREQLIYSEVSGNLLSLNAKTGKQVQTGSILALVDTFLIKSRLERAQLARFNSEKEYESQLLGYENLLRTKSKEQADAIRQKLKISTGLAGAEQDIKEAAYSLSKTRIRAPFTGIVSDIKVQQGEELKAGHELFLLYDPSAFYLDMKILEADVALVKIGTMAELSPVATPELTFKAAVTEINPYVDKNGLVAVKLKLLNHRIGNQLLFPGMNCTAVISAPLKKTVIVPKDAVVVRNGQTIVFTMEKDKAKWNYVTVGRENGREVEIKKGIQRGQKVIISNNLQLSNDAPVRETVFNDSVQHKEE